MDAPGCVEVFGLDARRRSPPCASTASMDLRTAAAPSACPWLVVAEDLQRLGADGVRRAPVAAWWPRSAGPTDERDNLLLYQRRASERTRHHRAPRGHRAGRPAGRHGVRRHRHHRGRPLFAAGAGRAVGRLGRLHQRVRRADGRAAGAAADLGGAAWRRPRGRTSAARCGRRCTWPCWPPSSACSACCSPTRCCTAPQVPPALQDDVRQYLGVLALALPPALLFRMYSTLNQSLGKPQLVTWLQLASLAVKVPLTIWFAFGGAGLPAHGRRSAAPGPRVVVNYAVPRRWPSGCCARDPLYRPYAIWQRAGAPALAARIAQFARLGVPGGPGDHGGGHLLHADGAVHRAPGHAARRPRTRSPPTSRR